MKILFMGVKWPPETFLERLMEGLMKKGARVSVVATSKPDQKWLEQEGFEYIPYPRVKNQWLSLYFKMQAALHGGWDVIYFPWLESLVRHSFFSKMNTPIVISCRGSQLTIAPHNPNRAFLKKAFPVSFEASAAVHCVSKSMVKEASLYGLRNGKSKVIYTGIDPDLFVPLEKKMKDKVTRIVTTARLNWRKGIDDALKAMLFLKKRGVLFHYDIIGGGPDLQRTRFAIIDLGLQSEVTIHDDLIQKDVLAILQKADIFLLPSLSEGISNAVIEAMACEVPVVSTECGGMSEAIDDGVEGYLVPIQAPEKWAEKIEYLSGKPQVRKKMGLAGRERVLKHFHMNRYIEDFYKLFKKVAHKS